MAIDAQENRPLLQQTSNPVVDNSQADIHQQDGEAEPSSRTPLPIKQLVVLCVMRITEPISFTVIFPFINQMIEDLNIAPDRSRVGSYAGLIESLFAFSQLCTVFTWGRLSDRVGRKPVLLTGLTGLAIGMISFGFQHSLTGLFLSRAFAGAMNGNVAVVKSVLAEITDETNQATAFPLLPLCYSLGLSIGPAIGGYLAKPAAQYPNVKFFANHTIFTDYPYFLPCLIAGLTNILAIVLGIYFLEETLPAKHKADFSTRETRSSLASADNLDPDSSTTTSIPPDSTTRSTEEIPSLRSLLTKKILMVMLSFSSLAIQNSSWMAVVPLFAYTRVGDGGLGLTMKQIGSILSIGGLIGIVVQTCLFPALQRRLGTIRLYRCVALGFPLAFVSLPIISAIVSHLERSIAMKVSVGGLVFSLMLKGIANMSIVCVTLLVNSSAPSQSALGTINGIGQSCASFSRSIAPGMTGYLFSESVRRGNHLVWVVLLMIAALGYSTTWFVEEGNPEWRKQHKKDKPVAKTVGRYGAV